MREATQQWKYDDRKGWIKMLNWCYDYLGIEGDSWYYWDDTFYFYDEKCYTMFTLKWL